MEDSQTEIFNTVSVSTVNYSDVYNDFFHKMDIYTPDENSFLREINIKMQQIDQ